MMRPAVIPATANSDQPANAFGGLHSAPEDNNQAMKNVYRYCPCFRLGRRALLLSLVASVAVFVTACAQGPAVWSGRFLYVVDCDASVDRLDTVQRQRTATFTLPERSVLVPKVLSARAGLDGCIEESVLPDAPGKQVSVIVPATARANSEGKRDFQWLTFTLPEWTFVGVKPAGKGLEQPPFLQRDANGVLVVQRADERRAPAELDLREYKNATTVVANSIIESSGDTSLVRVFTSDKSRFVLALANQRTRTLTQLAELPTTTVTNVHLAPGGDHILVEVTKPQDGKSSEIRRTGALRLYDANGAVFAEAVDEGGRDFSFVAFTPQGDVIYRDEQGGTYRFVQIGPRGVHLGRDKVSRLLPEPKPSVVLSDR